MISCVFATGLAGCGGGDRASAPARPSPAPFVQVPAATPTAVAQRARRYLTARLVHTVRLRAHPGHGRTLAKLHRRTEFGSPTVLGVTARRGGWLQVVTPVLRNHHRGWVPERATLLAGTDYEIR